MIMEVMSTTTLRQHLYTVIDKIIATGVPQYVERKGHRVKIVLDEPMNKLDNVSPQKIIVGDPDELVTVRVDEWDEEDNL